MGPGQTRAALLDADQEARQRAWALEITGKLPAGFTQEHYQLTGIERRELRRLQAALKLASDPDTFVALAHNRPVPVTALEQRFIAAHDRRMRVR